MHPHVYFCLKFIFWYFIKMNPPLAHSFQQAALKLRPECGSQNSERTLQKH